MGEKVETKNEGEKKAAAEVVEKAAAETVGKKDEPPMTVVLKMDLHCEGCAKKVRRSVGHLEGVEAVKADCNAKKLTVTGNVDPLWLRDKVEAKTKKKVELISPLPSKGGGNGGDQKKSQETKAEDKKADDNNKPKEAAISTVTMKTKLHCDGCAHKIKRIIIKNFDGVDLVTTDLQKDLITVVGRMDEKKLVEYLREKLKRGVDIIRQKKDDDAAGEKVGDEKEKGSGEGGEEKKVKESGGANKKEGGGETKVEVSKMEQHSKIPETHYAMSMNIQSYGHQDYGMYHHQQQPSYMAGPPLPPPTYVNMNDNVFSDENPNGCYVM